MPVGKSATIHRLTGQFIHSEMKPTTGAQVSLVYWPGKCAVTQQEMIIESGRTLFWVGIDMIRDRRERSK